MKNRKKRQGKHFDNRKKRQVRALKKIWNVVSKDLWTVLLDIIAVNVSYFLALLVRFYVNFVFRPTVTYYLTAFWQFAPYYTVLAIAVFAAFRLYGGMWRYVGINDMNRIIMANVCTSVIQIVGTVLFIRRMPITYYIIGGFLQFLLVSAIRFVYRIVLVEMRKAANRKIPSVPTMVIGAGETARKAINHLEDTPFRAKVVVDEKSAGKTINGVPIQADFDKELASVRAVFIADPNLTAEKRNEIKKKCETAGVEVQDYTGYLTNLGGRVPVSSLLELAGGKVTLVIDGRETEYESGEEAIQSIRDRYDIKRIEGMRIELVKSGSGAYAGYEAWARQHKEQTGEDVSFF